MGQNEATNLGMSKNYIAHRLKEASFGADRLFLSPPRVLLLPLIEQRGNCILYTFIP